MRKARRLAGGNANLVSEVIFSDGDVQLFPRDAAKGRPLEGNFGLSGHS